MTSEASAEPAGSSPRDRVGAPILDISILVVVSMLAYGAETWVRDRGLVGWGEDSRGIVAVLAGAAAALTLVFARGDSLADIGFKRPARWWSVPLWVVGIFAAFVVAQTLVPVLVSRLIELPAPDLSRHNPLAGNLRAALVMALVLPLTASIPEEIIYRGFLMSRLTAVFGAGVGGAALTVGAQSLIFGAAHFGWGVGGMIVTTLMGVVWGVGFLLCGRNLWIVILAHSLAHLALVAQLYASPPA